MDENERPFTDSLSTDIVVLSCFLNSVTSTEQKLPTSRLTFVDHISTLLNVGSNYNSVNAVAASLDLSAIRFVVSAAKNALPPRSLSTTLQDGQKYTLQSIIPNAKRGEKLLMTWSHHFGGYTFDSHLQDIFDIIVYMKSSWNAMNVARLVLFVHRRAFRKLGCWVKEFLQHWGPSPFKVVEMYLPFLLNYPSYWEKSFNVNLGEAEYQLVTDFVEAHSTTGRGKFKYRMDSSNMKNWITLFESLFHRLEDLLLDPPPFKSAVRAPRSVKSTAPDETATRTITLVVGCLYALRSIWKDMFSIPVPQLQRGLRDAENPTRRIKEVADEDELHDIEFVKEPGEASAFRIVECLSMVTRWYSSSISLWSRTSRDFLQRKSIDVNLLHWDKTGPFECADDQLAAILEVVSMQAESASMQRIHQLAYNAGVHAEAALMGTVYDSHSNKIFGYTGEVTIGVSTKCCPICRMLKENIDCDNPKLILSGAHSVFLPWAPPPGVPVAILQKIRKHLLEALQYESDRERIRNNPGQCVQMASAALRGLRGWQARSVAV